MNKLKFQPGMDTGSDALRKAILEHKVPNVMPFLGKDILKFDSNSEWDVKYFLCGNYYEVLYGVGKYLKLKNFLEIGVRYGYSAMSFAVGARDTMEYFEGWDICQMDRLSNDKAIELIEKNHLIKCDYKILNQNSFEVERLDRPYDMVYVDGAHEEEEKWHDFILALEGDVKYLVIDDCKVDNSPDDWWPLVLRFVNQFKDQIEDYTLIETYNHGTGVVIFK